MSSTTRRPYNVYLNYAMRPSKPRRLEVRDVWDLCDQDGVSRDPFGANLSTKWLQWDLTQQTLGSILEANPPITT